jgi:hypothetical protein
MIRKVIFRIAKTINVPRTSVVANVAKGTKEMNLFETLQGVDKPLNVSESLWELTKVSDQIVQILGSHFPLQVDDLDMGIDKKGKGWLIEVNIKPFIK